MNDDFPPNPPATSLPAPIDTSLKSPLQSKSDEQWDDADLAESIWRFNEAVDVSDNDGVIDFGDGNGVAEDDDDDDDKFEERLTRLSMTRAFSKNNRPSIARSSSENADEAKEENEDRMSKNRLSASAEELLRDLHNSKLQIQGLDQNIEKRRKEFMRLFLHADRIYSSPLTRALETAVVSMEGHRALQGSGITLYR